MYDRDSWMVEEDYLDPEYMALSRRWSTDNVYERLAVLHELGYTDPEAAPHLLDDLETLIGDEWTPQVKLYGYWIQGPDGLWNPDPQGEWAALTQGDDGIYLQVVWSHHKMLCVFCSPCYPDQGDLDTPSGLVPALGGPTTWAYCLPPELCQDDWASKPYICRLDEDC
jgi:hypothetical protein